MLRYTWKNNRIRPIYLDIRVVRQERASGD